MAKVKNTLKSKNDPFNVKKARETRALKNNGKWHADDFNSKTEQTMLERYGEKRFNNDTKRKITCISKYGVDHPMKTKIAKDKLQELMLKKYGVPCVFMLPENRGKTNAGIREKTWKFMTSSDIVEPCFSKDDLMSIDDISVDNCLEFRCKRCGKTFTSYWESGHSRSCPHCCPSKHGHSIQENELLAFLNTVPGITVIHKTRENRSLIPPKEIDFILKDATGKIILCIEYDGLYWHSENRKSTLEKTMSCNSIGLTLIHVFENEWLTKREIVKSRIMNALGAYERTIYARKCSVKKISNAVAAEFMNKHHIQGSANANVSYGLFYGKELISAMSFCKSRFNAKCQWELLRFCSAPGCHIPGGAGKMLHMFETEYRPLSIMSYADLRWKTGNTYIKLGFTHDHNSPPNYWYFKKNDTRYVYSRMKFQKKKLRSLPTFNQAISEAENMRNAGYLKIYDCGSAVFIKTYENANN